MYSKDGFSLLVSEQLAKMADKEELLEKVARTYEENRNFGKHYGFSVRNEMKCPNCKFPLTSRTKEKYRKIIDSRLVFLDGMTFINDEKSYQVRIKVKDTHN